ncbi:hypothetical protein ACTXT7_008822, partial [Hymenolepis weldensis]
MAASGKRILVEYILRANLLLIPFAALLICVQANASILAGEVISLAYFQIPVTNVINFITSARCFPRVHFNQGIHVT